MAHLQGGEGGGRRGGGPNIRAPVSCLFRSRRDLLYTCHPTSCRATPVFFTPTSGANPTPTPPSLRSNTPHRVAPPTSSPRPEVWSASSRCRLRSGGPPLQSAHGIPRKYGWRRLGSVNSVNDGGGMGGGRDRGTTWDWAEGGRVKLSIYPKSA